MNIVNNIENTYLTVRYHHAGCWMDFTIFPVPSSRTPEGSMVKLPKGLQNRKAGATTLWSTLPVAKCRLSQEVTQVIQPLLQVLQEAGQGDLSDGRNC